MDVVLQIGLGIGGCYAAGTLVAGYYLARWRTGADVRGHGSGSAGARNTARLLGRACGIAAFGWDFAKGALAVFLIARFTGGESMPYLGAAAVVAGHVWPAQLAFRGGKGVAPAAGALCVVQPVVVVAMLAVYALSTALISGVERRALLAFAAGLVSMTFLKIPEYGLVGCVAILAIMTWTHRRGLPFPKTNSDKAEAR